MFGREFTSKASNARTFTLDSNDRALVSNRRGRGRQCQGGVGPKARSHIERPKAIRRAGHELSTIVRFDRAAGGLHLYELTPTPLGTLSKRLGRRLFCDCRPRKSAAFRCASVNETANTPS